jgi:hypothetical protein
MHSTGTVAVVDPAGTMTELKLLNKVSPSENNKPGGNVIEVPSTPVRVTVRSPVDADPGETDTPQ